MFLEMFCLVSLGQGCITRVASCARLLRNIINNRSDAGFDAPVRRDGVRLLLVTSLDYTPASWYFLDHGAANC